MLSREFCDRYVKDNKYVSLGWDKETGVLSLTFHAEPSDVSSRIPLTLHDTRKENDDYVVQAAKFFAQLRGYEMGRYEVADVDITSAGVALLFKIEKRQPICHS
jgi:hypothetical protein